MCVDDLAPGSYALKIDPGGWHFPTSGFANVSAGNATLLSVTVEAGGRVRANGNLPVDLLLEEPA